MIPGIPPKRVNNKLIQKSLESPFSNATANGGTKIAKIMDNIDMVEKFEVRKKSRLKYNVLE